MDLINVFPYLFRTDSFDLDNLDSLGNLSVYLNKNRHGIFKYFLGADIHSNIIKLLPKCKTINEISNISVCIANTNRMTTTESMEMFNNVVSNIVSEQGLNWIKDKSKIFNVSNVRGNFPILATKNLYLIFLLDFIFVQFSAMVIL